MAEVERLSGRPVIIEGDPSLPVFASVAPARGSAAAHVVRYKPGAGQPTDYVAAFQLSLVVRLFSRPRQERWQVAADDAVSEQRRTRADLGLDALAPQMAKFFLDNLITQVGTTGVGMRVDRWIRSEFPEFREQQDQAARIQLSQNEQSLAPEIRKRFPRRLVDANTGMNLLLPGGIGGVQGEEQGADPSDRLRDRGPRDEGPGRERSGHPVHLAHPPRAVLGIAPRVPPIRRLPVHRSHFDIGFDLSKEYAAARALSGG